MAVDRGRPPPGIANDVQLQIEQLFEFQTPACLMQRLVVGRIVDGCKRRQPVDEAEAPSEFQRERVVDFR